MSPVQEWFTWKCPHCETLDVTVGRKTARDELLMHIRHATDDAHEGPETLPEQLDPEGDSIDPYPRYGSA